jgi:hypothetical protein
VTLRELIDELQDYATEHGDDIEVRLAQQPRWAFEYAIGALAVVRTDDEEEDDDDAPVDTSDDAEPILYIGEGSQLGYLPGHAARALGWGRD